MCGICLGLGRRTGTQGLPCSHLCKQTTTAAVGEQEALKEQGLELLAGQRPALYPAYDI